MPTDPHTDTEAQEATDTVPGIAQADAHLGRPMPLPTVPLPLARWVDVALAADGSVEVEWNLDDTREGTPGRLALLAGPGAGQTQLPNAEPARAELGELRTAPLEEAQPSLRPVHELRWEHEGLRLRLTAQGPWDEAALLVIAESIR